MSKMKHTLKMEIQKVFEIKSNKEEWCDKFTLCLIEAIVNQWDDDKPHSLFEK